jgi:hypothetical protein
MSIHRDPNGDLDRCERRHRVGAGADRLCRMFVDGEFIDWMVTSAGHDSERQRDDHDRRRLERR